MSTNSVSRGADDFRAASGPGRWPLIPADLETDDNSPPLRGPGLFEVVRGSGERMVTNVRRIAGADRTPGSRLVAAATVLLGLLAAALFVVTLNAQYKYVFAAKGQALPSMIEAASLDLGMAIFTLLALGLAMAGQSARIERALIVACAFGSAAQNYAAADVSSPRSVAAYVAPSLFLALVVDRTVAVMRRHVLGEAEGSVWATVGRALAAIARGIAVMLLYVLRFLLAPPSTGAGLRQVVLNATPLPQAEPKALPSAEVSAIESAPVTEPPELEGASKKARLAWWYRQDPDFGNRAAVAAVAKRLAGRVDLSEGTARAYLGAILTDFERDGGGSMSTAAHVIGALLRFLFAVVRGVVTLAVREQMAAFVVLVILVALVLFWRVALTRHGQGWRRVRSIRFRLWLRLRPGRGFASLTELWLRWGRLAALAYGARSRPGLSLPARLTGRTAEFAAPLGRAQYGRRLYAAFELHRLILAPPRTDKTGMLADWIIRHPGPALTTSTRADLHQLTSPSRRGCGPVYVFNPEGVGGVPSTFAWDLLGVCTDELMAHKMADWLAGDTPGYGDLSWFEEQGTMGMSGLLLAAAKTGATLAEVYQWVQRRGHEAALAALAGHGNPQLHAVVRSLIEDNRTAASVRSTIARALKWAVIPQLAAAAARTGTFNAREFALYGGTLHLINSGDSRSIITPLMRALASYVHHEAGLAGSRTAAGRLDPPLLMAMDEVAQVCPVDLPSMLADSAGKGIVFVTVGHSLAKLEERYGKEGAANIWAISGVKMLLRGITEPQTLEDVSRVCGTLGDDDDDRARIVPPDVLRRLPKHCALVINMDLSPAVVRVSRAWKRRSVRRLAVPVPALPAPREIPAEDLADWPVPGPALAPSNGHGGRPGPLARTEP